MFKYNFCFWAIACLLAFPSVGQTNRALVVTISKYPPYSGWEELHAHNDKDLVLTMLNKKGFDGNITVLADKEATKTAIYKALANLHGNSRKGDYIYLHFSCHGQQMMDDNGDEYDGLDEALIPYDAGYRYVEGEYEGENHLRDDELGIWINKFRERVGETGYVAVVADACHSGTVNRDPNQKDYIRGTSYIFAPDSYVPVPGKHPERSLHLVERPNLAPAVVFSACLPGETNYEYYSKEKSCYFGFLTYTLYKTMQEHPGQVTTKNMLERIKTKMRQLKPNARNRKQTPYMECTNSNAIFKMGF
ncbi:caspase family protein [Bacteroides sp. OttesenSCG-928-E20]|nr:caspase family protein [Bacteroides sp. OttesenSCG-928-E20]MDL2304437.1 caspase family protein [Bacteroides sp. OttesenSCG-928-D19]